MDLVVERLRAILELHGCNFTGQSLQVHFDLSDAKKNNPAGLANGIIGDDSATQVLHRPRSCTLPKWGLRLPRRLIC